MRELRTYGSVGEPVGNYRLYLAETKGLGKASSRTGSSLDERLAKYPRHHLSRRTKSISPAQIYADAQTDSILKR